jgi:tetratricopeptide (TPR) repeat protein
MIPDKKYNDIERYTSSEMTDVERNSFEQEIRQNDELAQVVHLYKDIPNSLNNIQGDLDFNQKLQTVRNNYSQTPNQSSSWRWIVIGIITIIATGLIWKQFFSVNTEKSDIEKVQEEKQTLPEGVPIASLWENTEMPPAYITRGGKTVEIDIKAYQDAHQLYSEKNYTDALTTLETITEQSNIYGEMLLLKGVCLFELEKYSDAIRIYDNYIKFGTEPQDMVLWYQALACIQTNQTAKAKSNLQNIIDQDYSKSEIAKELLKTL